MDSQPSWHRVHLWHIQIVRDLALIVAGLGIFYLGYVLQTITVPMLVGLGLAYAVEPLITYCSKRWAWCKRPRCIGALFSVVLLFLLVVTLLVVPALLRESGKFLRASGDYVMQARTLIIEADLPEPVQDIVNQIPLLGSSSTEVEQEIEASAQSTDATDNSVTSLAGPSSGSGNTTAQSSANGPELKGVIGFAGKTLKQISEVLAHLLTGIFDFGLFIFLTGFFFAVCSLSWPSIRENAINYAPHNWRDDLAPLLKDMDKAVSGFIRGRLTITAILMLWFSVGWWLCGVPHAMVLGTIIGALTLVPYVSVIGVPLACGLLAVSLMRLDPSMESSYRLIADGGVELIWWKILLFPALIYLGAQLLDDYVLSPLIQGEATGLSMAAIIVAVIAGGELAGLYGMLLAIPFAACIKIALTGLVWPRVKGWLDGRSPDPF